MSEPETCPRPGCDLPYTTKITDSGSFAIRAETFNAAKLCIIPIHDGERPAFIHVYHTAQDVESGSQSGSGDERDPQGSDAAEKATDGGAAAAGMPGGDHDAPGDISPDHEVVYDIIDGHMNDNQPPGESIQLGVLRKKAMERGVEKEQVKPVALNLVYHGFVRELESGLYQAADVEPLPARRGV